MQIQWHRMSIGSSNLAVFCSLYPPLFLNLWTNTIVWDDKYRFSSADRNHLTSMMMMMMMMMMMITGEQLQQIQWEFVCYISCCQTEITKRQNLSKNIKLWTCVWWQQWYEQKKTKLCNKSGKYHLKQCVLIWLYALNGEHIKFMNLAPVWHISCKV